MRKFSYIFILFAALFCSCNDNTIDPSGGGEQILVPTKPYIYLDAAVDTRASLVGGTTLGRNFGIYGYTYDFNNKWSTYRVTAKPNVFDNVPQTVTHNNGNYQYTPIKKWEGGKYTFFAYYPTNLRVSDESTEGTPYVLYAPDFNDARSHVDVMTAMFEDTSLSSSPYVYFDFYHRLSAVDVVALNFYEYNYSDPNNSDTVISENIIIDIVDLSLSFENVQYKEAKIYMDRRISSELTKSDENTNPNYQILTKGEGYTLSIDYNNDATIRPITSVSTGSMIFIPQENTDLEATISVTYKKRRPNGQYVTDVNGNNEFTEVKDVAFNQPLKEGSRYYLQMTFTSAGVAISVITSDEWKDITVGYEFE